MPGRTCSGSTRALGGSVACAARAPVPLSCRSVTEALARHVCRVRRSRTACPPNRFRGGSRCAVLRAGCCRSLPVRPFPRQGGFGLVAQACSRPPPGCLYVKAGREGEFAYAGRTLTKSGGSGLGPGTLAEGVPGSLSAVSAVRAVASGRRFGPLTMRALPRCTAGGSPPAPCRSRSR